MGNNRIDRRDFIKVGAMGLVASTAAGAPCLAQTAVTCEITNPAARKMLKSFSQNTKQLWTVVYVDAEDTLAKLESDIRASFDGGADAAILESNDARLLETAVAHARSKFSNQVLGCNHLGDESEPYGYVQTFRLAQQYNLQIAWVDFSGVDLVKELPEISLHKIQAAKPADVFYVSGIHMKYGTLLDPTKTIEQSALQAIGWVDGIVITGPKTGVPTDPERARRARGVIGNYPMGAASGVTAENVHTILAQIDYCLVNTSVSDAHHRILENKVRELRHAMRS